MKDLKHPNLKPVFITLVAFDHSDWVRSLGNALTRELKRDDKIIVPMLDKEDFRVGSTVGQLDGLAIVQTAADQGRLLELTRLLKRNDSRNLTLYNE